LVASACAYDAQLSTSDRMPEELHYMAEDRDELESHQSAVHLIDDKSHKFVRHTVNSHSIR